MLTKAFQGRPIRREAGIPKSWGREWVDGDKSALAIDHGINIQPGNVVDARFVDIVPGVRVVQAVDFVSDDPAFAGTMTMTWAVTATGTGTEVEIRADDVPDGISAEDHAEGLASSLANLAAYLETATA
ncbi:MAG: hypothetical protein HC844_14400 [Tabrizicola sp.]|nr:hypothetical protein [Tabrizicola sp.]